MMTVKNDELLTVPEAAALLHLASSKTEKEGRGFKEPARSSQQLG